MERKKFLKTVAFISLAPALLMAACKEENKDQPAAAHQKTYTCPMHPQIVQDKPGACPICGMDLVPFDKSSKDPSLTLGESQVALANITTITVGAAALSNFKRLNGRLATDPEKGAVISSRVPGRLDVLYIKETGVKVNKGQPLYKIYSEELAALQQEYLVAVAQLKQFQDNARFQQIEKAARQKLALYGQSDSQIDHLLQAQKVAPYVTYYSPENGVVAELSVTEGQYVAEGSAVMRLDSYSQLWVEGDIYPAEASEVRIGQTVKVVVTGYENEPQTMTIRFIDPALQSGSQLMQIRGTIPNAGNRWQAGMQANIFLPVKSKSDAITLPVDAVIRDGRGTHVWMETGKGKFEPRMVTTGMENFDQVAITDGLKPGDKVVITGAYLLYSEYVLKKGADPMAGHKH